MKVCFTQFCFYVGTTVFTPCPRVIWNDEKWSNNYWVWCIPRHPYPLKKFNIFLYMPVWGLLSGIQGLKWETELLSFTHFSIMKFFGAIQNIFFLHRPLQDCQFIPNKFIDWSPIYIFLTSINDKCFIPFQLIKCYSRTAYSSSMKLKWNFNVLLHN